VKVGVEPDDGRVDAVPSISVAGHSFRPPVTPTVDRSASLVAGGPGAGSARAQRQVWTATLSFLRSTLVAP
jgi:hypothetical protein